MSWCEEEMNIVMESNEDIYFVYLIHPLNVIIWPHETYFFNYQI